MKCKNNKRNLNEKLELTSTGCAMLKAMTFASDRTGEYDNPDR